MAGLPSWGSLFISWGRSGVVRGVLFFVWILNHTWVVSNLRLNRWVLQNWFLPNRSLARIVRQSSLIGDLVFFLSSACNIFKDNFIPVIYIRVFLVVFQTERLFLWCSRRFFGNLFFENSFLLCTHFVDLLGVLLLHQTHAVVELLHLLMLLLIGLFEGLCFVKLWLFWFSTIFYLLGLAHISLSLGGIKLIVCLLPVMRVELIRVLHISCARLTVVIGMCITLC